MGFRADFNSQYSLLEVLGKGNFGVVWLAASRHDPSHQVAVKILPKVREDKSREETLACIKREVALWGSLSGDSRYVAQLLGLYEDGGSVYLVQQRCYGDLATAMQSGPLSEPCAAAIMWCVLSAIRDCHDHHLAMVDVKPQNFLLTSPPLALPAAEARAEAAASVEAGAPPSAKAGAKEGAGARREAAQCACPVPLLLAPEHQAAHTAAHGPCVVACDFGCSLSYSELMRGGRHGGSPIFFAPEQFSSSYGLGVDVWAAGVMLYLLLSGRYPFWDCKREDIKPGMKPYEVGGGVGGCWWGPRTWMWYVNVPH
ncbi:hypothetical protein HYH02_003058 [Chlamydomonas schloesseri]|uniref:Protein kinase domain-containing protein n=1 Tax=Chlamydomonas schloesseri TaxID=2026947 RepID=A0A836BAE5_9CHLO|nr:hypothetical protein HYH02_003058 [Chlamydomonas schloesseri]|eukprot:KAG2452019.1 hypothetical protein HYH02_003058 [Chlamydomonas schloesseri]